MRFFLLVAFSLLVTSYTLNVSELPSPDATPATIASPPEATSFVSHDLTSTLDTTTTAVEPKETSSHARLEELDLSTNEETAPESFAHDHSNTSTFPTTATSPVAESSTMVEPTAPESHTPLATVSAGPTTATENIHAKAAAPTDEPASIPSSTPLPASASRSSSDTTASYDANPPSVEANAKASHVPEPELLSFNEWREKYAASVDQAAQRKAKRTAGQRVRQDPNAAAAFDGDGADFGSLFASPESEGAQIVYEGAGENDESIIVKLNALGKIEQAVRVPQRDGADVGEPHPGEAVRGRADVGSPKVTPSVIQPLPNVGTGAHDDPLLMLKDRFNYALFECAAMVHRYSPGTKGATSILVEKKDRYMLTPCSVDHKFVELELCDEIRIDTVVLANFELFSSMFKRFSIFVSQNYPGRKDEWHKLGEFRAKNMRGVQVFRPPGKLTGFYRYMRIEFQTHYGSEFYCPVSLLRVYGLTHFDAYRKDEELREAQAALAAMERDELDGEQDGVPLPDLTSFMDEMEMVSNSTFVTASPETTSIVIATPITRPTPAPTISISELEMLSNTETTTVSPTATEPSVKRSTVAPTESSSDASTVDHAAASSTTTMENSSSVTSVPINAGVSSLPLAETSLSSTAPARDVPPFPSIAGAHEHSSTSALTAVLPTNSTEAQPSAVTASPSPASTRNSSEFQTTSLPAPSSSSLSSVSTPTATRQPAIPPPAPSVQPGDSIFGIIMKRLGAVEHNQNLSMHYVEAQGAILRDAFLRLDRRMTELENARAKHDQLIQKGLRDLEEHFSVVDRDKLALAAQVNLLTQELLFEKRLGIAQLVGILTLFIFVGVTRGSPTTPFLHMVPSQALRRRLRLSDAVSQVGDTRRDPFRVPGDPDADDSRPSAHYQTGFLSARGPTTSTRRLNNPKSTSKRSKLPSKTMRTWTPPPRHMSWPVPDDEFATPTAIGALSKKRTIRGSPRPRSPVASTSAGLLIDVGAGITRSAPRVSRSPAANHRSIALVDSENSDVGDDFEPFSTSAPQPESSEDPEYGYRTFSGTDDDVDGSPEVTIYSGRPPKARIIDRSKTSDGVLRGPLGEQILIAPSPQRPTPEPDLPSPPPERAPPLSETIKGNSL